MRVRERERERREKLKTVPPGRYTEQSREESRERSNDLRDYIGSHGLKYVERGLKEIKK